jgi:hypothetical protein
MMWVNRIALAGVAALAVAGSTQAATYSAVGEFSSSTSNGPVWGYGTGVTGTSFAPYANFVAGCLGSGFACWQTPTPVDLVPTVIANLTGSTQDVSTIVFPDDVLLLHPGPVSPAGFTDSIVQFTAPTAGKYDVSGFFETLDVDSHGVGVTIAANGDILNSWALPGHGIQNFNELVNLAAGQTIDFGVSVDDGDFYFDSTGLSATITSVPEPGAWALILLGFSALGVAMRSRRPAIRLAA